MNATMPAEVKPAPEVASSQATAAEAPAAIERAAAPQPAVDNKLVAFDTRPMEIQKFEFQQRAARLFATSGLFADIRGQSHEQAIAQAFVKISLGDSMGFNPAESMTGIDIIQGRVAVGASLRAARMQRAGYSWDILQLDEKGCRLQLKYKGQSLTSEQIDGESGKAERVPAVVSFMSEDAARAGLLTKDNYKKYPPDMLFARAITRAQRWYAPGVLGVDILSSEEAIDMYPIPGMTTVQRSESLASGVQQQARQIAEKYAGNGNGGPANPPQASVEPQPQPLTPPPAEAASPSAAVEAPEPVSRATSRRTAKPSVPAAEQETISPRGIFDGER